jgi:glycosyltransferase involved in cell wall biosynthesis
MKIGIIGTRGIPNHHGGFEQFAMFFSEYLAGKGYDVVVYNSSNHPYQSESWKNVVIKHCYDPEPKIGTAGQFIYDFLSILDARKQNFDVIFQLGYTSSSIWGFLFPKESKLITNMDGLEWKRSKYSGVVKSFLKIAEKWAVKQSDILIADSKGIQEYILTNYQAESHLIAYGAEKATDFDESTLNHYNLIKKKYNLVIARLEPENNIEPVLKAHEEVAKEELLIIGSTSTKHGKYLESKYKKNIRFLGGIYDFKKLNDLRHFSNLYFHGHSVGGTNPSLLEAMACSCSIVANDNIFNRAVLGNDAFYFSDAQSIIDLLTKDINLVEYKQMEINNMTKIETIYNFNNIHEKLVELINK